MKSFLMLFVVMLATCAEPVLAQELCQPGCWLERERVCTMRGHHPYCSWEWFWVCDPCYDECDPNDGDTCE